MTASGKRLGRPFNTFTPLGKLMLKHELSVHQTAMATAINPRILSYYLSAQRMISQTDLLKLVEFFELEDGNELIDYEVHPAMNHRNAAQLFFSQTTDDVDISGLLSGNNKTGTKAEFHPSNPDQSSRG